MQAFDVINAISDILAALLRMTGMIVLGFGLGKFSLEMFHKGQQSWQLQSFLYVGMILLLAAAIRYGAAAETGGLALGLGIGLLMGLRSVKGEEKAE
jgi:hypothetical protein